MSYALEAANKLHNRQLAAATKVQHLLVKAVDGLSDLREKAPTTPDRLTAPFEKVAAPLEKVTGPVRKVVGTPHEIGAYVKQTSRDWAELQQQFQASLFDRNADKAESPGPVTVHGTVTS